MWLNNNYIGIAFDPYASNKGTQMKYIITLLFAIVVSFVALPADDSTKVKQENKIEKTADEKADPSFSKQKKKKDAFIDKDGDGICDHRANGMSFEKMQQRHQYKKGASGDKGPRR